jgi:hypothetical protein
MPCCSIRRQACAIDAFGATVDRPARHDIADSSRTELRRLARQRVRPNHHLQPWRAVDTLTVVAQQVALADNTDDMGGRVDHGQAADVILQHQLGRGEN